MLRKLVVCFVALMILSGHLGKVYASQTCSGFTAWVREDVTSKPIGGAQIKLLPGTEILTTDANGIVEKTYNPAITINIYTVSADGYKPETIPMGPSSDCRGNWLFLKPQAPTPTPDGGETPSPDPDLTPTPGGGILKCGETCLTDADCFGSSDGCGFCFDQTACVNPDWAGKADPQPPQMPCVKDGKLPTAVGCLPAKNVNALMAALVIIALGVSGGISFLLMLFGAFKVITSSGDPKGVAAGSELITSALAGLLLIIFSLFLLKLVGADILQIPGFAL